MAQPSGVGSAWRGERHQSHIRDYHRDSHGFEFLRAPAIFFLVLLCIPGLQAGTAGDTLILVHDNLPPYEFMDSAGNPGGFIPDLAAAIARETGRPITVKFQAREPWHLYEGVTIEPIFTQDSPGGKSDLVVLMPVEYGLYMRGDQRHSGALAPGSILFVPQEGAMVRPDEGYLALLTPVRVSHTIDGLTRLGMGLGDAAILDIRQAEFVLARTGSGRIGLTEGPRQSGIYGLAFFGDDGSMAPAVREAIARIRASGEFESLFRKWFVTTESPDVPDWSTLFFSLFTPVALLLLAVFSWSWALRYQVEKKTRELQKELEDRRRAEEALTIARNHLDKIIDSIADPVFVKDRNSRWVILNEAFCRFLGHSREDLIGKTDYDFFPRSEAEVFRERDAWVFSTGKEDINEEPFTDASGQQHMILTKKTLYTDPAGNDYIVGVISDVTARKRFEEEIRRFNEELELRVSERTNELEHATREMESFTYSVSHDLRAPLRAIDGFSSILLMESGKKLTADEQRLITLVRQNILQMSLLIDGLLNLSRTGRVSLHRERVEPALIVAEVFGEMKEDLKGKDVTFLIGDLPACTADRSLIRQVFANLISNALKFSHTTEKPQIEVGARVRNEGTVYYVRDNGIGFDMKYYGKLFGVFQRLHNDPRIEGTGVGLAIVQRIIQKHGGKIWAESELGKGATFYFTLGDSEEL